MRAARGPFGPTLLLALVAGATTWAALTAWRGFITEPSDYLGPLLLLAAVVAVGGAALRWIGTPAAVIVLVQVGAALVIVSGQLTGSLLPLGGAGRELIDVLRASVESAQAYAAPISPEAPPVWPLLLAGGAVFVLLVDVVACTFRRVPAAGLALLAIYSVPSGLLEGGPGWVSFLIAATGFLTMLHLDAREQLLRWGRPLGPNERSPWGNDNPVREAVRAGTGRIGIAAVALALVLPAFIPVLDVDLFELGAGSGDGDIRIRKPITDMRRDLERGEDVSLIRFRTDDPDPEYLRVSVLNRFTGTEWSSGDRDVDRDDRADGALPAPVGLSDSVPRTEHSYDVDIATDFDSTWLPTQFPATSVTADGDWRFDPASMDFLAADDDLDTRGMSYQMVGMKPTFGTSGEHFRDAPLGAVEEEVLELPSGVPAIAHTLARSVTAPAANDYERALLLQRWFRRDGGFKYDLRRAPEGTGNGTLASFLSTDGDGRVGYCEQFASAMAVMARIIGIPARVAVGFLEPTQLSDGSWEYSSHDLHAWPELYFAGTGWVRFEPTPSGRVASVPAYSRVPVAGVGEDPAPGDGDGASDQPSGGATVAPPTRAPTVPEEEGSASTDGTSEQGSAATVVVIGLVVVLLLGLVLAALHGPRWLRDRARRTRLGGDPDEVWEELRATAIDLGVPWADGRSPRELAASLVDHLADPGAPEAERPRTGPDTAPEAALALDRVVLQVERARYARPGSVTTLERTDLGGDAGVVAQSLRAGVTPRSRRRARWLPRSLWRT